MFVLVLGLIASTASASAAPGLFVVNGGGRNVSAYTLAPNGAPVAVAGSPFATEIAPVGVAMTPDAEHVYVTNLESKSVSAYTVGPEGGLSPVPGSPFVTGFGPWGVAVSPDGDRLYVTNSGGSTVSGFSVASDGSLSSLPGSNYPIPDGNGANGIAIAPDGEHLYTSAIGGGTVSGFSIAADGSLTPVPGSPYELESTLRGLSITPDGRFLYVANTSKGKIAALSVAADGTLSPVPGSPFEAKPAPLGLAVDPTGTHLYMAHVGVGNNVWAWSIGSAGELTPVSGSPFPTGGIRGNSISINPAGTRLYTTNNESWDMTVYSIGAGGTLSFIPGSPFDTGFGPLQLVVSPDQGPTAEFAATATPAGNPSFFDASASSDPDGSVAKYHWDFGDGETAVTASATATHRYDSAGEYTVTLTVADNAGCSTERIFTGQTVGCNGSSAARTAHDVTVPPGVPLDVSVKGSGSGSVASSPAGIACPLSCSYAFEPDTEVTLTANPTTGSSFTGWSGGSCDGSQESSCAVTMTEAEAVAAEFTLDTHLLEVVTAGPGKGTVSSNPVGVGECGAPTGNCQTWFDFGSLITLTATPEPGSIFTGWSGGGCAGSSHCDLEIDTDLEIVASFATVPPPPPTHTLTVGTAGAGGGTVTTPGGTISCPPNCSRTYVAGTQVALTASPAPGSRFADWSGECSGGGPCQVTLNAAVAVTARFEQVVPVPAALRIARVRPRLARAKLKIVVWGTVAKAAQGVVRVKLATRLNGRRLSRTARAKIRGGRWRARLTLPAPAPGRALKIKAKARFGGSAGVDAGRAKRNARFSY